MPSLSGKGAADAVDDLQRVYGCGVATPGDVLIGPDEDEVALVEGTSVCVADVDDLERHAPLLRGIEERGHLVVGEPQPDPALRGRSLRSMSGATKEVVLTG